MLKAGLHEVQRGLATLFGNAPALQVDADVAAEGHRDANMFLARCGLDPIPVTPRDRDDGGDESDDRRTIPQTTAYLALETLSHVIVQDCTHVDRQAAVSTIVHLSKLKAVLLLKESTFRDAGDDDYAVCRKIGSFDHGRMGFFLALATGLVRLQAATPEECCRHVLRRICAAHCLAVGHGIIHPLLHSDPDKAAELLADMEAFADVRLQETEEWHGPPPPCPAVVLAKAELQVQHVRAIQATLTRQQELARLGKCIDAFRAAVHAGAESDEVGTRALLDQCQLLRENARTTGKDDAAVPAP